MLPDGLWRPALLWRGGHSPVRTLPTGAGGVAEPPDRTLVAAHERYVLVIDNNAVTAWMCDATMGALSEPKAVSRPSNTLMAWSFIANGASPTTSSAPTAERGIAQLVCGPSSTSTPHPVRCVVSTCIRCGAIETVTLCASHTPVGTSLIPGCAITVALNTARSAAAATTSSIARSVTPWFTRAIDHVEDHLRMRTRLRRPGSHRGS